MLGITHLGELEDSDKGKRKASYEAVMNEIDINKDGVIDYTEFITAAIDKASMLNKENLLAAFQLIDRDNSGMITIDELQDAFDSHKAKDAQLWEDIMKEVDKNNDNKISIDEFMEAMTNYLKKTHIIREQKPVVASPVVAPQPNTAVKAPVVAAKAGVNGAKGPAKKAPAKGKKI